MSTEIERSESGETDCCASCGVKESDGDDIKLKDCSACHLVKYCGVKCQKEHRKKHKRACKKRAAELRDEILFRQSESSHLGDCPICFLPLPLDPKKCTVMTCCSKIVCDGCNFANQTREFEGNRERKCAFCRTPVAKSVAEGDKRLKDRAAMNDPVAMYEAGKDHHDKGDYKAAFEYWSKVAQLGDVRARYELAILYHDGRGVERDESKAEYHYEQAAIGGHPAARHNLGVMEWNDGRRERAVKHWIIAAKLGDGESLEYLKNEYKAGLVNKDDLAEALRGHQAAIDATKSPQREEAAKAKVEGGS